MLKLFVGDIPLKPLVINVAREGVPVDLTGYTIAPRLVSPEGSVVSTAGGSMNVTKAAQGTVSYNWPSTTLFSAPGEYKMQLHVNDEYTSVGLIDVYRP